jgi:hypothetical protein
MMVVSVVIKQVSQKGMAVINKRLAQAGVRLAWMVNRVLKSLEDTQWQNSTKTSG